MFKNIQIAEIDKRNVMRSNFILFGLFVFAVSLSKVVNDFPFENIINKKLEALNFNSDLLWILFFLFTPLTCLLIEQFFIRLKSNEMTILYILFAEMAVLTAFYFLVNPPVVNRFPLILVIGVFLAQFLRFVYLKKSGKLYHGYTHSSNIKKHGK